MHFWAKYDHFISKVLERLFLSRFQPHILGSSNFNRYQSAYRPDCSTETALQLLLDRIYSMSDEGRPILLVSLDLSAAFDMVDHATFFLVVSVSLVSFILGLNLTSMAEYSLCAWAHPLLSPTRSFSSSMQTIRNSMSLCHP